MIPGIMSEQPQHSLHPPLGRALQLALPRPLLPTCWLHGAAHRVVHSTQLHAPGPAASMQTWATDCSTLNRSAKSITSTAAAAVSEYDICTARAQQDIPLHHPLQGRQASRVGHVKQPSHTPGLASPPAAGLEAPGVPRRR
jgi:hypothetical protein